MSSLAAARADNFYHPPDYDPAKHKSLNKYHGSHGALGARANKLDQGILVIRFEVPFHLRCTKCGETVAKGERFNAEKKAIGMYHTTKIWEFRMNHHCSSVIIITTDPKNAQYCVVEGARAKIESYTAEDAEVIALQDEAERERLRNDPLYRLEHGEKAKVQARTAAQTLQELQEASDASHRDDYAANKLLRARMRRAKKEDADLETKRAAIGLHDSIKLLPEDDGDAVAASIAFLTDESRSRSQHGKSRTAIMSQSIFGKGGKGAGSNSGGGGGSSSSSKAQGTTGSIMAAAAAAAAAPSSSSAPTLTVGKATAGLSRLGPGPPASSEPSTSYKPAALSTALPGPSRAAAPPPGPSRSQRTESGGAGAGVGVGGSGAAAQTGVASTSAAGTGNGQATDSGSAPGPSGTAPPAAARPAPGAAAAGGGRGKGTGSGAPLAAGLPVGSKRPASALLADAGALASKGAKGSGSKSGSGSGSGSLMAKAELLAKRQRLGGVKLQLGAMQ